MKNLFAAHLALSLTGGAIVPLLATTWPLTTHAQDASEARPILEQVTVTARRREENLQRVPIAITALSGEDLYKNSVNGMEDLRFHAPSLQVSPSSFGISVPGYTLRGQRQLEALATQDPSVVVYIADVPYMRPHGTNGAFYDLQNVFAGALRRPADRRRQHQRVQLPQPYRRRPVQRRVSGARHGAG